MYSVLARVTLASIVCITSTTTAQISTRTAPSTLNSNAATDLADDEFPRVATDGDGHWIAIWQSRETVFPNVDPPNILVSRSGDKGATWTDPVRMFTNETVFTSYSPQIAADSAGNAVVVWHSQGVVNESIGPDFEILVSRTFDNGLTWTSPTAVKNNAATDAGQDNSPDIATDNAGNWIAVWTSNEATDGPLDIGDDVDILLARSTDNGATWSAAAPLNTNATTDSSPDQGAVLATDGAGTWIAVWSSGFRIRYARSTNNGVTWSAPEVLDPNFPTVDETGYDDSLSIASDGADNWIVTMTRNFSSEGMVDTQTRIVVTRSSDDGDTWITDDLPQGDESDGARIHADWAGTWVITFVKPLGLGPEILFVVSSDEGATWTSPEALNIDAATDSAQEGGADLATDRLGNWVGVWSFRNLNPIDNEGEDYDIRTILWFSSVADLDNLYVDFTAMENGIGTEPSPFDNITEAVSLANDDAVINLAPGTSNETFLSPNGIGSGNQPLLLMKNGTGGPVWIGAP